jgi:hypothetical protein
LVAPSTRPIVRDPEQLSDATERDGESEEQDGEELVVLGAEDPGDPLAAPARDGEHHDEEEEGDAEFADDRPDRGLTAEHHPHDGEVDRDEDVLDHRHAEDHGRLAVGQSVQLDEQLGDDGAGRGGRDAGDDERLTGAPPHPESEGEADRHVDEDVRPARHEELPGVAEEFVLVELQSEVEQQQDQPEDRDELDVAGVELDREPPGVRARDHADQHVDRDGGQTDELAQPSENIGNEQERPENRELFAQLHG